MDGFDQGDTVVVPAWGSKTSFTGRANLAAPKRPLYRLPARRLAHVVLSRASGVLSDVHPVSEVVLGRIMARLTRGQATSAGEAAKESNMSVMKPSWPTVCAPLGLANGFCPRRFHPVSAIHPDRVWHDLERVFRHSGFDGGVCVCNSFWRLANASNPWLRKPSEWFIFLFRGSPLFIQFFFGYFLFLQLKTVFPIFAPFTAAWLGALVVLFFNTSAYSAEIFYGALQSIPKGDTEAADAYGLSGWTRFKRVIWPTMLRLAWPAYTNEAIFLFHATTLVFFTGFPAWQQRGDALYYASYFADKTFNPFIPYPILAMYFIILTLIVISVFGTINRRLNRHLPDNARPKLRWRPTLIR